MFQRFQPIFGLTTILLFASIACSLPGLSGENDPDSPYQMGLAAIEQGNFEEAHQHFDDAVFENLKHAEAYYYRAYALHQTLIVEPPALVPPTKPPDPEIPDPPPEPVDQSDSEAVAAYLEQLQEYQNEIAALQVDAEDEFREYENAIVEYQAAAVEQNQAWVMQLTQAYEPIFDDINMAIELGLPAELELQARDLLASYWDTP
ncbi:MAG: hypothetical protein DWQ07_06800 [Chloroflexi bacterium]|nr:MAG: hypothetical protein DWQ07_06800 [Chloroflexota bacterium]MBL1195591.1 hypothetical protein [Chloroflexota bacterium]NOH12878.1 hypothetical protein [Chloroflexota bacterium]